MNIEEIRDFALSHKAVTESFPFGEETLVFKVGEKIFLLMGLSKAESFNAKCNPEKAVELRESYSEIVPGYHMNKKHWNTVFINGSLDRPLIKDLISHSYDLVFASLPKKTQLEISKL